MSTEPPGCSFCLASTLHTVLGMRGHNNQTKIWYRRPDGRYNIKTRHSSEPWARIVMENCLRGKPIPQGYEIHHINDNHTDDRKENLQMMPKSLHIWHHRKQGQKK